MPVFDDLRAERGVGGRDGRRDHRGSPRVEIREEQHRQPGSDRDRDREPDEQESHGHAGIAPQHSKVHTRGVGEQQQRQRHLGQAPHCLAVHVHVDRGDRAVGEHEPDHDEDDRRAQIERLQTRREESPQDERRRDRQDQFSVETLHQSPSPPSAPCW